MSGYDQNGTNPDGDLHGACTNSTDGYELEKGYNGSYWFKSCNAKHTWDKHIKDGEGIIAEADANWANIIADQPFCYNTNNAVSCYCTL